MSNRIIIKSIRIKNFRSIRNELIEAKNMNIFVGLNDAGKSNVLKALNLFFNGQTDYGVMFDFKKDFSYYFPMTSHGTKEIVIEIKFIIPDSYKEKGIFTWKKVWRINNYTDELITNEKGERPSDRSRVPGTLKRIRYRYVPAVKSKDYYKSLLSDLYFTVSAVLDSPLEASVNNFSKVLQEYTIQISNQVSERLHISSKLSIPENLSELFKTLEFETQNIDMNGLVALDKRGDGIQARHIPIILKYIADEDQKTRNQGSMKVATIWGFEEPENGVELSKAFEMANDFEDFSQDIQMFITTHSPAFYMKNNDDSVQVIYVTQGEKTEGSKLKYDYTAANVGQFMGLMPIVAPYIAEQEEKIAKSKRLLDENILVDTPTIMVEGKTDKQYLELAIKLFSERLYEKIKEGKLRIFTKEGEGGCKKLIELTYAWIYSGNTSKAIVLFDKDAAGISAKNELGESVIYKTKRASASIQIKFLEPSNEIIGLYKKNIELSYEIEHLLSINCWLKIKEKDFVEPREFSDLNKAVERILTRDKTVDMVLDDKIDDYNILNTIVTFNPHKDKKEKIYRYIESCKEEEQIEYLSGLKKTVELLERNMG
ncbi:MAG: AAA family ATPase [Lachnospiraceae bacterium]|nr:AAA family ATPase [Lachnospiraceae bacterium]